MKRINLRDLFPVYELDCYIEVPDGDAEAFAASITKAEADVFIQFEQEEIAYLRRVYRNKAQYSLDCGDGIERDALYPPLSPAEIYEHNQTMEQLYAAIASLPDKQAKRICAHYFLGMSKNAIARAEGTHESSVRESIKRALRSLKNNL